jgi:hypothetical protein
MKNFENSTPEEKKKLASLRDNVRAAVRVNVEAQLNLGVFMIELRKKYSLTELEYIIDSSEVEDVAKAKKFLDEQQDRATKLKVPIRQSAPAAPNLKTTTKPKPSPVTPSPTEVKK